MMIDSAYVEGYSKIKAKYTVQNTVQQIIEIID